MQFFDKEHKDEVEHLKDLLREAQAFILQRGVYYYADNRRGPASDLSKRIDDALANNSFFGDK
jgi:hypothetical protein